MPTYVHNGSGWQELTGTDRPYVNISGTFQGVKNIYAHNGSGWQQVYQYDNTGPTVPTPTASPSGADWTVSWGAITDSESGVATATCYQLYVGSTSGFVPGSSYSIPSGAFGGGSTTFTVPTNRRNTPSGETWYVTYYIIATDNAGNSTQGGNSTTTYTRPYGNYTFAPANADAWNGSQWMGLTTAGEGMVRYSSSYPSGAWFYGTSIYDACKTFAADSGTIWIQRPGASQTFNGNTGTFYLKACDRVSNAAQYTAPTFVGTQATQYLAGYDATALVTVPGDWLTAWANGTAYGAGLYYHTNQPGYLRGLTVSTNNNPYGIYSGTIFLTYN
jgi:hypothetical protein